MLLILKSTLRLANRNDEHFMFISFFFRFHLLRLKKFLFITQWKICNNSRLIILSSNLWWNLVDPGQRRVWLRAVVIYNIRFTRRVALCSVWKQIDRPSVVLFIKSATFADRRLAEGNILPTMTWLRYRVININVKETNKLRHL